MAIRKVPAGNGVTWITEAVQLILKNPGPFALMGLVIAVAGVIPILGTLALAVLGPALYGGIAWAARDQSRGEKVTFEHLFRAFQQEGKIGPMLLLCLPGVIGGVIVFILAVIVISITVAGVGVSAATESNAALWASLGVGGLILLVFILALAIAVFTLTFFAIPDLMFRHNDAIGAMKQSMRASIDNIGAVLLYLLILMVAMFITVVVLSLVSSILAQFLVSIALAPVVGTSMYMAWKDVYRDLTTELPAIDANGTTGVQDDGGMVA